jgi:hypothetical protein
LGEGEGPLAVIPLQVLLSNARDRADVVCLDRLRAALLPELAELAVIIEFGSRRLASVPESPQFPDGLAPETSYRTLQARGCDGRDELGSESPVALVEAIY